MNEQNNTHELKWGLGGNGERHWSLPVIHEHANLNSPTKVDNELVRKGERHWSLPIIIHEHANHNSPTEVDNGLGGKGEKY